MSDRVRTTSADDHYHELPPFLTVHWSDLSEGERWKATWGVFWRTLLAQIVIVILLVMFVTAAGA